MNGQPGRVLFGLVSGGPGGGQKVALAVARELVARGASVSVLAPNHGARLEDFQRLGANVFVTGPLRSYDLVKVARVKGLLKQWGVTCVYTHTVPVQEAVIASAARLARIRLVIHRRASGNFSPNPGVRAYQRRLWRSALRGADEVVCVSDQIAGQVTRASGRRPLLIPNGIGLPDAARPRADGSPLVGFIGRLDANKRVEDFLQAAAIILRERPDARFIVVGEGNPGDGYESRCRRLAQSLGLATAVTFTGALPETDDVMQSIDVLVLPSVMEGHPIVLLEAMAQRKAIVATDIPGCRETISDGLEGRLVPIKDPQAIAQAVTALLNSPAEMTRLGNAARERVERDFSETRMVDSLLPLVLKK